MQQEITNTAVLDPLFVSTLSYMKSFNSVALSTTYMLKTSKSLLLNSDFSF